MGIFFGGVFLTLIVAGMFMSAFPLTAIGIVGLVFCLIFG